MRMIGATSAGMVLVEMSSAQFEALTRPGEQDPASPPCDSRPQEARAMAVRRKLESVRACILKLRPRSREELFRAVQSVHGASGGIRENEIGQILQILLREGVIAVDPNGGVGYPGGGAAGTA